MDDKLSVEEFARATGQAEADVQAFLAFLMPRTKGNGEVRTWTDESGTNHVVWRRRKRVMDNVGRTAVRMLDPAVVSRLQTLFEAEFRAWDAPKVSANKTKAPKRVADPDSSSHDPAFVPARAACKRLGITPPTLRSWDTAGKIQSVRTPGGHRRYNLASLGQVLRAETQAAQAKRRRVIYCRVGTPKQRGDLQHQTEALRAQYPSHEVVTDIGSGINFRRRGFLSLVDAVCSGAVEELVVAHRDRLCRFGWDLIQHLCDRHNTRLVVAHRKDKGPQSEFVDDLRAIIHVFSCRYHGLRTYERAIEAMQEGAAATDADAEEGDSEHRGDEEEETEGWSDSE